MLYESVIEKIWINFIKSGAHSMIKGPTPQEFLRVCERFRQAEEGLSSEHLPLEIKSYLAERRVWEYYYLISRWQGQHFRKGYTPQFGWCSKTGQPWFAIRCSAIKSYPTLCGPGNEYLSALNRLTPIFVLFYERLGPEGPLLLWPEFKNRDDIKNATRQHVFNCFRGFLQEWASEHGAWTISGGRRAPVSEAFQQFKQRPTSPNQALPLPAGFSFDLASS
ncbi:hypothetical protein N431DRAFT_450873 [Stipitochalara longipes BDJ]|nr:hypothetical protein N431DRAFT_450873 [Stipitochalara longipes BDJ]